MSYSIARSRVLTVSGIILLVVSAMILGSHYFGQGRVGRVLSSASLPPGLSPPSASTSSPTISSPAAQRSSRAPATPRSPTAARVKPGVPVAVIATDHRLRASVQADRLNADGSLFVPPDPGKVSWSSQHVAPGSAHGTIILVGHVNYGGVSGAFGDLASYRTGQIITLLLADGRRIRYSVAAEPIDVKKVNLGPRRQELFDQTHSYGLPGDPKTGRLLLLSCGGIFDNATGHYESNIFVYAIPV